MDEKILVDISDEARNWGYKFEHASYPDEPDTASAYLVAFMRELASAPDRLPHKIDVHFFRRQMVSVAGLAIKAIEWCDRKINEMEFVTLSKEG